MKSIPQKDLRNNVGEVLRRAEAGEELEITVSGRPVARLLPLDKPVFLPGSKLDDIYRSPTDDGWMDDIRAFEAEFGDPFELFG